MRWALLIVSLLACQRRPAEPDMADDIGALRHISDVCWERNADFVLMHWQDIPEYVALRPRVVELVQSKDPAVLRAVGGATTQCGDLDTLAALVRRSPKSPPETRAACHGSDEFFAEYDWACSAELSMRAFCCKPDGCRDRDACTSFCESGCAAAPHPQIANP